MSRAERRRQAEIDKVKKKSRKGRFEEKIKKESLKSNTDNSAGTEAGDKAKKTGRFKNWFNGLARWKKITLIAVASILALALIFGIAAYAYFSSLFDEIHEATPEDYDLSLVDVDGYYNILLLGVDSRDMDNLEGTRSDAIMILSINKDTNDVKILSVYRDTYLKMGSTSKYDKITHACAYGGPEMTMKSLNQALDLNISNYVVVNFKAVADLVDEVGGIEVDVQDYEIEQLNKYTIETAENIGREDYSLVKEAGVQTLEGVQAVSYGRIRKGVGDDFKRTERMRTVLSLVMDKMKEMSFKEIKNIIKIMTPQVQTNLSKNNILALGIRLPQYNIIGTEGWPYHVDSGMLDGVSYVFPTTLKENVIELHKTFFGQEDYVPSTTVDSISNTIAEKISAARSEGKITNEESMDLNTSQTTATTGNDNSTGSSSGGSSNGSTTGGSSSGTGSGSTGSSGGSSGTNGNGSTGSSNGTGGNSSGTGNGSTGSSGGTENTPDSGNGDSNNQDKTTDNDSNAA